MDYDPADHVATWRDIAVGLLLYLVTIGGLAAAPSAAVPDPAKPAAAAHIVVLRAGPGGEPLRPRQGAMVPNGCG